MKIKNGGNQKTHFFLACNRNCSNEVKSRNEISQRVAHVIAAVFSKLYLKFNSTYKASDMLLALSFEFVHMI